MRPYSVLSHSHIKNFDFTNIEEELYNSKMTFFIYTFLSAESTLARDISTSSIWQLHT